MFTNSCSKDVPIQAEQALPYNTP